MDGSVRSRVPAAVADAALVSEKLVQHNQEYRLHLKALSRWEKYPAKQHARRVQEKLGVRRGLIYLAGQPARSNEDSDMPAPWRQRRYFYYLSGVNEPNCHVTYDIQNDVLTLFLPRIDPKRVIWNGRGSTPAEALDKYDLDQVFFVDEMEDYVYDWMKFNRGDLYLLHPTQSPQYNGLYGNIDSESLQPAINRARIIKDEHEVQMIRKANEISSTAHKLILANISRFKNEAQVEGLFLDACISRQAKQQAYDPIAASGVNAGTLHYDANNEDFEDRQLMCLDAGCEWNLYASDITRTFPLSGSWPSAEAKNTYLLVQKMQDTCIERLGPGVRYLDIHILAHQIAIDGLLKLGILHNGTSEEIFNAGTSRAFFPHGLGHHVGLEVHDVGQGELMSAKKDYSKYENVPSLYPQNFHQPVYDKELCMAPTDPQSPHLEEGMIVTVEPGIYFSVYALNMFYLPSPIHSKYINLDVVKKYLPVGGVRIEDDILITSKGYENLTTAPKGEAMLDIIRSRDSLTLPRSCLRNIQVGRKEKEAAPLRAPGIPKDTPVPVLKPITRAATLPIDRKDRRCVDFEPFEGPSLYSGFKRASTTDLPGSTVQSPRLPTYLQNAAKPLCGKLTQGARHAYLKVGEDSTGTIPPIWPYSRDRSTQPCSKCNILMQTLERLSEQLEDQDISAKPQSRSTGDPLCDDFLISENMAPRFKRLQQVNDETIIRREDKEGLDEEETLLQKATDKHRQEQERLKKLQERLRLTRASSALEERHAWLERERTSYNKRFSGISDSSSSSDQKQAARKGSPTHVPDSLKAATGAVKDDILSLNDHPPPAMSPWRPISAPHKIWSQKPIINNDLATVEDARTEHTPLAPIFSPPFQQAEFNPINFPKRNTFPPPVSHPIANPTITNNSIAQSTNWTAPCSTRPPPYRVDEESRARLEKVGRDLRALRESHEREVLERRAKRVEKLRLERTEDD
ncbi:hypothetical protein K491DRAFT_699296 [Lophiostoma macrostomum CBS 122681]|uniref:Xaa-Pro aminopeptidase n=1 Tax=Lophiostoma macrostomum CBS 122681 TaxID=1314788 RepID=A0A6A6SP00_9PLEO|nr:hypothetical protein K491DRAFT_699296 [Lophiostoma macrostomum CBS 122681]